ncbi:MAG: metal-dependent hydrolase [Candidatus Heimdallarchaeota archaeon]
MTWGPTHVALEAFLVWVGMGKKNREIFNTRRGLFALLTLFALFPDLDTFIYIHRTYLHSIVWPIFLILGVTSWLIIAKYIQKKTLGKKADLLARSLIIIGAFILLHNILDLTTGPVLLFYPFDNRLYNLNAYMIWDLDFPLLFKGFNFEWTSISLNEGINTYFLNLSPEDRIQYFGAEFILLYITDFPLHALIFVAWFIFFPVMGIIDWTKKYQKPQKLYAGIKKFKSPLIAFGLILLSFGIILGPALHLERVEDREYSTTLFFSEDQTNYGVVQSFELDGKDSLTLTGDFAGNNSYCTIGAAITTKEQFTTFSSDLDDIFDQYNNESLSLSYSWLIANYQTTVNQFLATSLEHHNIVANSTQELSSTLSQQATLYSIFILVDWNSSIDFQVQTQMISTLTIKRTAEFYTGISLASIGLIVTLIPFALAINLRQKEEEKIVDKKETDKNEVDAEGLKTKSDSF